MHFLGNQAQRPNRDPAWVKNKFICRAFDVERFARKAVLASIRHHGVGLTLPPAQGFQIFQRSLHALKIGAEARHLSLRQLSLLVRLRHLLTAALQKLFPAGQARSFLAERFLQLLVARPLLLDILHRSVDALFQDLDLFACFLVLVQQGLVQ